MSLQPHYSAQEREKPVLPFRHGGERLAQPKIEPGTGTGTTLKPLLTNASLCRRLRRYGNSHFAVGGQ